MPYFVETENMEEGNEEDYELEVTDSTNDYCADDSCGAWIFEYLFWLQKKLEEMTGDGFTFSDFCVINDEVLDEIEDESLRTKVKQFTDDYYQDWLDTRVSIPNYGRTENSVEEYFCSDCNIGWRDIEDEETDEVIDREWTGCPDRCESFWEAVEEKMREDIECDLTWLDAKWKGEIGSPLDQFYARDIPMPALSDSGVPVLNY